MKKILLSVFIGLLSLGFVAADVQAKRLGGGLSQGMKRQMPPPQQPRTPPQPTPAQQPSATPGTAGATAAAAAAPRRSWMGPIAGLAAGIGLAALMSHLGVGAEFANILTILLLAVVAFMVVRFLLRRFGPQAARPQYAGPAFAGGPAPTNEPMVYRSPPAEGNSATAFGSAAATATTSTLPPGFDTDAFGRAAKMIFIRMQAANDEGDLDDLRQFATPEMFAAFRVDLQDRKGVSQRTDVVQLDAQVLDCEETAVQQVVSVRFHGLIRESQENAAAPFDEVWHLVKPRDGSREWAIAGIAQHAV